MVDWTDRKMTCRAIRRLADRLEEMAENGGQSTDRLEEEQLDIAFKRMHRELSLLALNIKLPLAEANTDIKDA